jgi:hypothetical protein
MSEEVGSGSAAGRAVDELKLQAWLARAEFRNASMSEPGVREEVSSLLSLRDELALQAHLGQAEAKEEWSKLESRWEKVKHTADNVTSDVQESLHDLLSQIRDGYQKLRGKVSEKVSSVTSKS